jgi:serine/threonine protein kinase
MGIENLSKVWPNWKITDTLGEGAFGKVYKAVREEYGVATYSAIKVISIPQSESELSSLRAEGMDDDSARKYLQGLVNDFVGEIKLLETMKGTPNVVSVEDFAVLENPDSIGWDIFIRMELLTGLNDYIKNRKLTEEHVIRLGQDILVALELCSRRKIIHRDIKPENIFVSPFGYYKLGDFGAAREMAAKAGSLSQKGTFNYMAPEVAAGGSYDATVDTYSLGIVLYRFLNNNRLPFLDPDAQSIQYQDRKDAIDRRFRGDLIPPPVEASEAMAQVILKACAFDPKDRYRSPSEFRRALAEVRAGKPASASAPVPVGEPKTNEKPQSASAHIPPTHTTTAPQVMQKLDATVVENPEQTDYDKTIAARRAPPAQNAYSSPETSAAKVGDVIKFGGYDWLALDIQDGKALVMSTRILCNREYNKKRADVTWADCTLRTYLNGTFLGGFNAADRGRIAETHIANKDNQWYGTSGGVGTTDKVFLLSLAEVVRYFGDSSQLAQGNPGDSRGIDDQHNKRRIARDLKGNASWWWLRSPGFYSYLATIVSVEGHVIVAGYYVESGDGGVLPAMWLKL